jgi:hypothetical protein
MPFRQSGFGLIAEEGCDLLKNRDIRIYQLLKALSVFCYPGCKRCWVITLLFENRHAFADVTQLKMAMPNLLEHVSVPHEAAYSYLDLFKERWIKLV